MNNLTHFETSLWNYIMEHGISGTLNDKECKYINLDENYKVYAYFVTHDYVMGTDESNKWIIDTQTDKALLFSNI